MKTVSTPQKIPKLKVNVIGRQLHDLWPPKE